MKKSSYINLIIILLLFSCSKDGNSIKNDILGKWNCFDYSGSNDLRNGTPPASISAYNNQGYQLLNGGDLYLIFNEYNYFDSTYIQTVDINNKFLWYLSDDESKLFIQLNENTADEYEITTLTGNILGIKSINGYNILEGTSYYFDK